METVAQLHQCLIRLGRHLRAEPIFLAGKRLLFKDGLFAGRDLARLPSPCTMRFTHETLTRNFAATSCVGTPASRSANTRVRKSIEYGAMKPSRERSTMAAVLRTIEKRFSVSATRRPGPSS